MTFTANDWQEFLKVLEDQPQAQAQFRAMVLSDELQILPDRFDRLTGVVDQLAQAQQRTEERVDQLAQAQQRTEERLNQLVQAQQRTEERLNQLVQAQQRTEERLDQLVQAQQRTEERLDQLTTDVRELTADVRRLTDAMSSLAETQKRHIDRLGMLTGFFLETRYREHAAGYFGRWLRRARAVNPVDLEETLETRLEHEDMLDVLRLDLLVNGRWRAGPEPFEVWLAVAVAAVLNEGDVARAWRRARLLHQAGYRAVPVVAGERITDDGQASARAQTVSVVLDGQATFEAESLATWLN